MSAPWTLWGSLVSLAEKGSGVGLGGSFLEEKPCKNKMGVGNGLAGVAGG